TDILYSDRASTVAVIQAGGLPIYIPSLKAISAPDLSAYVDLADGLLVTGEDANINPDCYGEIQIQLGGRIDDERDRQDIRLIKCTYTKRLPLLGICKGMQIINVALKGTLYQNVAVQHPDALNHDVHGSRMHITHYATLADDSLLKSIFHESTIG
ncbi:MAG: gamma-glutamyl-gamma-aminobutyrate hydrolase family protein, partial [Candidatus Saccharimonadales bacterium]